MRPVKISSCYSPTTVVLVDDDAKYLSALLLELDTTKANYRAYGNPVEAFEALKNYQSDPFTHRCISWPEAKESERSHISIDIRAIQKEIYNPKRFQDISVLVVDYAMPGMNGLALCDQLASQPFKKILLTGEADEKLAVQAFEDGLIHSFVRKDSPEFTRVINDAVDKLQRIYFSELSSVVIDNLIHNPEYEYSSLKDPAICDLLNEICKKNQIVEYYLADVHGSFLMLDTHGKPSWLAIANEELMETYLTYDEENLPISVREVIQKREMFPYFYSDADYETLPADWEKYLHPAQVWQGKETYYYAYISDTNLYDIDQSRVLSYRAFLDTLY